MNTIGKFLSLSPQDEAFKRIIHIDLHQFPKPWGEKDWNLNWDHHLLYGWEIDGTVQGFALLSRVPGDNASHLLKICFDAQYRGSGHASIFWEACLENLKGQSVQSIFLEVESENEVAISFYTKSGFKTLRRIKGYYSNGSDAVTMLLTV